MFSRDKGREIVEKLKTINDEIVSLISSGKYSERLRIARKEFVDAIYFAIMGDKERALKHVTEAQRELDLLKSSSELS
ncbi:MAG: hypothetical protein GXO26_07220 [Crenarchaeota archaeon]|nr:hypothetical protein [Thermoproteota archaeon]